MNLGAARWILWSALAVLFLVLGTATGLRVLQGLSSQPRPLASTSSGVAEIGGEFSLVDHEGQPRTWSDFRGKPVALFFGFSNCPDICPTTLGKLSVLLDDLGPQADDLQVLLITGDPKRDTPERLNAYLQSFDPRIVALTGTEGEVEKAFSAFKAYRAIVPLENGDYTIDHSAGVYLFDREGSFFGTLDAHETTDVQRQKIERLLAI
ncbi:MAG TPA: SCO family protein [Aurantimonas coralicida]|uniref:SCO family protein n=2 Tax=root TaxID=1 RepID=A0A9C9NI41_9HYPH|nr:SCO family protein [Aurantimonas coralicida]HEU01735.1 SCO family protein [Aurantimonas coralicida]